MLGPLLIAAALSGGTVFAGDEPIALQLNAPFNDLFAHARGNDEYPVRGTLSFDDEGERVTIDGVKITVRGNTSKQESECPFPKLKIEFPNGAPKTKLFGTSSIKIGTHCGDTADELSGKFGRLANQNSPRREVFVYRLLAAVGVATLKARPATMTYVIRIRRLQALHPQRSVSFAMRCCSKAPMTR